MNKTFTKLALFFAVAFTSQAEAQVNTENFDSFSLLPNSYYKNTTTNDWQTTQATFQYQWDTAYGGYWTAGSAYTNMKDTVHGTYTNLYGNITGAGYSGDNYVTVSNGALIKIKNLSIVSGFFITNTTYDWKVMKQGNSFSRKFGDTTGTGSGTTIAQGDYPDWFLLTVKGFRNGLPAHDSIKFYLADLRPSGTANDYIIKNWQFVNCTTLGIVDSIRVYLSSSDTGPYGMNTPGYFSIDNFITNSTVGIHELASVSNVSLFPNPASDNLYLSYTAQKENTLRMTITDVTGKQVLQTEQQNSSGPNLIKLQTASLEPGVYFVDLNDGASSKTIKFVKL